MPRKVKAKATETLTASQVTPTEDRALIVSRIDDLLVSLQGTLETDLVTYRARLAPDVKYASLTEFSEVLGRLQWASAQLQKVEEARQDLKKLKDPVVITAPAIQRMTVAKTPDTNGAAQTAANGLKQGELPPPVTATPEAAPPAPETTHPPSTPPTPESVAAPLPAPQPLPIIAGASPTAGDNVEILNVLQTFQKEGKKVHSEEHRGQVLDALSKAQAKKIISPLGYAELLSALNARPVA